MKIELHSCSIERSSMSFPLGPLCIKSFIQDLAKVEVVENLLTESPENEAQKTVIRNPDCVGVSVYLWNKFWFEQYVKSLRALKPSLIIFAGGTEITASPVYKEPFDFLVAGEGETPTRMAIKQIVDGEIPHGEGIITKDTVIFKKHLGEDTETLPSPFLVCDCEKHIKNNDGVLWEMTRGCPYSCAFCFESRGSGSVRHFPEERLKEELQYFIKHNVKSIFVLDPTFNMDRERCENILRFLVKNAPSDMHFSFELRAELITKEMANLFGLLNCSLQIGLQTTNQEALKYINRTFDKKLFTKNINYLNKNGSVFGIDLIIGLPGDNLTEFRNSLDYVVSMTPSNIDLFQLAVLPGTELYEKADLLELDFKKEPPYTINRVVGFSGQEIKRALEIKEYCDLFYTKGQSCMWINLFCDTMSVKPSECFERFGDWMKGKRRSKSEDIYKLQDDFVSDEFFRTGLAALLPAMQSYMELHQAIAFLYETGEVPYLNLSYNPDELSLLDKGNLEHFVQLHKAGPVTCSLDLDEKGDVVFI